MVIVNCFFNIHIYITLWMVTALFKICIAFLYGWASFIIYCQCSFQSVVYIYIYNYIQYIYDVGWGITFSVFDHLLCSMPTYCIFYHCFVKLYILNMGNSIRHINYVIFFFSSFWFLSKFIIFWGSELIYSFNIIPVVSRY